LNIDSGINNEKQHCRMGTVRGEGLHIGGRLNGGDEGDTVDALHIPTQNRTMKPPAIALSGAGRESGGEMEGAI
jgi:hypothetical protein